MSCKSQRFWFGSLLLMVFALPGTAASAPTPPPGWKMELVAEAPALRHPSVVACAPDGRVFVAEDPMDISAPSANLALGRILCIETNGRVKVFAEGLYAVFGMQYLEGKLYVLHNPKFSVFEDGVVGGNRRDLIESTHPNPWALDWNDHVPANFRLAMDGFFYLAVGDKGMFNVRASDGSQIHLHGGGVVRMRPDATRMEIFSTGVRNILDVALDSEDEIFTYDNTDEHEWMGRVTHMVEGGFYGYPFDFIPRRPYTLWMMDDLGGGAATGAFIYNDDTLPSEYQGNLFLADFGKRQVMRLEVKREGGSFRVAARHDFFTNPPPDFRPVGIAPSADGRSIYICDWQHADTKEQVTVGRLWKMSHQGKAVGEPKPGWHLEAALGGSPVVGTSVLVKALDHSSHPVRLSAQRLLGKREGAKVELRGLLRDKQTRDRALVHGIWAAHAMDGGASMREDILQLARSGSDLVRRQAMRQLGLERVSPAATVIGKNLASSNASIRFQAATALGRLGNARSIPDLQEMLAERDLFVRFAAFTALRRIGQRHPEAWTAIVRGLESEKVATREGTRFALREVYDPALVKVLSDLAVKAGGNFQGAVEALGLLAGIHRKVPEWKGEWWAYHPFRLSTPAKTLSWEGTPLVETTIKAALLQKLEAVQRAAVQATGQIQISNSYPLLQQIFQAAGESETRVKVIQAWGELRESRAEPQMLQLLEIENSPAVLAKVLETLARIGTQQVAPQVARFLDRTVDSDLKARALELLGKWQVASFLPKVEKLLSSESAEVRRAAVEAWFQFPVRPVPEWSHRMIRDPDLAVAQAVVNGLGKLKTREAVPLLLGALAKPGLKAAATRALLEIPDDRAVPVYLSTLDEAKGDSLKLAREALVKLGPKAISGLEQQDQPRTRQGLMELEKVYQLVQQPWPPSLAGRLRTLNTPAVYQEFALKNPGVAGRGKQIFEREQSGCLKCHRVGSAGALVGPDLTTIGLQFSREALVEHLLFPSRSVREGYQLNFFELKDGETIQGILKSESPEEFQIVDAEGRSLGLSKKLVRERSSSSNSLMPEGLEQGMTLAEFADLVSYLESLKK